MAVDTARKRHAMLNFGDDIGSTLIVPDGTVTALDRATLLALYEFTDADDAGGAAPAATPRMIRFTRPEVNLQHDGTYIRF